MTIGKTGVKTLSSFSLLVAVLFVLTGLSFYLLFTIYTPPKIYNSGELITIDDIELKINSLMISDRVVGYREPITEGVRGGNQIAHPDLVHKFLILDLTFTNKGNQIVPLPNTKDLKVETHEKNIYAGNSIFEILQTRIRTYATQEEIENFYCELFSTELTPKSSIRGCLIFHIPSSEEPLKFFYLENQKIRFVVGLK